MPQLALMRGNGRDLWENRNVQAFVRDITEKDASAPQERDSHPHRKRSALPHRLICGASAGTRWSQEVRGGLRKDRRFFILPASF